MTKSKKFGGRPRERQPQEGERVHLGIRVTPEMKERIEKAAELSGRSQSQEAELRLERSFDQEDLLSEVLGLAFGKQLAGVLMMLGYAMLEAGRSASSVRTAERGKNWIDDPYAYEQAVKAAADVLDAIHPPGKATPEQYRHVAEDGGAPEAAEAFKRHDDEMARSLVLDMLWTIQKRPWVGRHPQFAERAPEIRALLGPITERLKLPPLTEDMAGHEKDIAKLEKSKKPKRGKYAG